MKNNILFIVICFLLATGLNAQNNNPVVSNVRFEQRTDGSYIVDIYYDLSDSDGDSSTISVIASNNLGVTYRFGISSVTGDLGSGVTVGTDKHIEWNFAADHPEYASDSIVIKVIANDGLVGTETCPGTPTVLYEGKTYNTILIGDQCWLKENLDIGTMIASNSELDNQTNNGTIEKYCYNNNPANCETYGGLYQWNEAMQYVATAGTRGICPEGWHIPTKAEFETLNYAVNGSSNELKAFNQGTNTSGFSGLFGGRRYAGNGLFYNLESYTNYWSSSENGTDFADYFYFTQGDDEVYFDYYDKNTGYSVRCLKDEHPITDPLACPGTPTVLYEGKTYKTVQIGSQCWLKENLDIGTMIASNSELDNQTSNDTIEKYCYDNDPANCETYGGLYQWEEAMQYVTTEGTRGICPEGWHIPTYAEFEILQNAVSGSGNALKAIGQGTGAGVGTNTSGFSGLLAGVRGYITGNFYNIGDYTNFWSSTEIVVANANYLNLGNGGDNVDLSYSSKSNGFCVRCLKD